MAVSGQVQLEEGLWQLRARFDHPDYAETTSHEFWIGDPSDPTKPSPVIESPLAQGSYDAGGQSLSSSWTWPVTHVSILGRLVTIAAQALEPFEKVCRRRHSRATCSGKLWLLPQSW